MEFGIRWTSSDTSIGYGLWIRASKRVGSGLRCTGLAQDPAHLPIVRPADAIGPRSQEIDRNTVFL